MKGTRIANWPEFKAEIQMRISDNRAQLKSKKLNVSRLLFRGQASSSWPLLTTLERKYPRQTSPNKYLKLSHKLRDLIATFADTIPDCARPKSQTFKGLLENGLPNPHYLLYLRHHGYPSPLLDWTRSPYVAAFFALLDVEESESANVFIFQEYCGESKGSDNTSGWIETISQWIKVHPRHVMQQSEYTYCFGHDEFGDLVFVPHEKAMNAKGKGSVENQNRLEVLTLEAGMRAEAIRDLFMMNITPYTLFGTEDSLIRTAELKGYLGA